MKLATLCYVKNNVLHRTLMLHRVKKANDTHQGKWNGLGGKFMPGETPEDCAKREIYEECGLTVHSLKLHGFLTFPLFDGVDDWYVFVFSSDHYSGELIECKEGNLEWIDDSKLLELNLWEGDKHFLQWMKEDKFFSANFVYKDKKLTEYNAVFY